MNHSPFKNHHTMIRVVGVIAALFGLVTAASGAARYSLTDLGTPYGARAAALNERGQVTGYAPTGSTNHFFRPLLHAFLYSNGALTDLGTLGGTDSFGTAINERGQVTGYASTAQNAEFPVHAFLYSNGALTDLGTLGGTESFGTAINERGQVTGMAATGRNGTHAFLYSNGAMTDLGTLGGAFSNGLAINERGHVTG